jgi:hypothetical protein
MGRAMLALLSAAPSSHEPIKLANPSAIIIRFMVGLVPDPEPTPGTRVRCQQVFSLR